MLHAATVVVAFCALWLLWTQQPLTWDHVAIGFVAALLSVAFSLRAAPASVAFSEAPKKIGAWLGKIRPATSGVLELVSVALGAKAQPALVQLKRRNQEGASLAMHWGAVPGIAHVESDEDSLLFHVTNENAHEALMLGDARRGAPT